MFLDISVKRVRAAAGDVRQVIAISTSGFYSVRIECYVQNPPPPSLRPCDACGKINGRTLVSNRPFEIDLQGMIPGADGQVHITLTDMDESRDLVLPFGEGDGTGTGSSTFTPTPWPTPTPDPLTFA